MQCDLERSTATWSAHWKRWWLKQLLHAGKAVLEHHFDNHEYCGVCRRKLQTEQQLQDSVRYYRCKTKDAKLYVVLTGILCHYITLERLHEVAHGMDTQINESFNNTASWLAPKNKVYCGSGSLGNWISIAIHINSMGTLAYFSRLFKKLGIVMTTNVNHYLTFKDNNHTKRLTKRKTKDTKTVLFKKKHANV